MHVCEAGQGQGPLQHDLPGRARQQVCAPHDVGHALCRVVDHHRELVGKQAVAASKHKIADRARNVCELWSLDSVHELDVAVGCAEPPGGSRPGIRTDGQALGRVIQLLAGLARPVLGQCRQPRTRARAAPQPARRLELGERGFIGLRSRALAHDGTVPVIDAVTVEGREDVVGRAGAFTGRHRGPRCAPATRRVANVRRGSCRRQRAGNRSAGVRWAWARSGRGTAARAQRYQSSRSPNCFSRRSRRSWASTLRVATGRASRRLMPIGSPVSRQKP